MESNPGNLVPRQALPSDLPWRGYQPKGPMDPGRDIYTECFEPGWKPDRHKIRDFYLDIYSMMARDPNPRSAWAGSGQDKRDYIFAMNGLSPLGGLVRLPPEIRCIVWSFLCPPIIDGTVKWPLWDTRDEKGLDEGRKNSRTYHHRVENAMSILRTSRRIYEEVSAYLYDGRTLDITIDSWPVWQVRPSWVLTRNHGLSSSSNFLEDSLPGDSSCRDSEPIEKYENLSDPKAREVRAKSRAFSWYQRLRTLTINLVPPTMFPWDDMTTGRLGRDFEILHMHEKLEALLIILQREDCIWELAVNVIEGTGDNTWFVQHDPAFSHDHGPVMLTACLELYAEGAGKISDLGILVSQFQRLRGVDTFSLNLPEGAPEVPSMTATFVMWDDEEADALAAMAKKPVPVTHEAWVIYCNECGNSRGPNTGRTAAAGRACHLTDHWRSTIREKIRLSQYELAFDKPCGVDV